MSESSTGKTIYYTLDLDPPPALTDDQRRQLDALRLLRDEDIDFSDIPPITDFTGFKRVTWRDRVAVAHELAEFDPADKKPHEATEQSPWADAIGADVLSFFREQGGSPVERINEVLRDYVAAQRKSA